MSEDGGVNHQLMSMLQHSGAMESGGGAADPEKGQNYGVISALVPKFDISFVGAALGNFEQSVQWFSQSMTGPGLNSLCAADGAKGAGLLNLDRRMVGGRMGITWVDIDGIFGNGAASMMQGGEMVSMSEGVSSSAVSSVGHGQDHGFDHGM